MQRDGGVKVGFFRTHLHGDRGNLGDFGRAFADDVTTDDAIG